MKLFGQYKTLPHDQPNLQWVIMDEGIGSANCDHRHVKAITWYGGPGGPLLEITCLNCKRKLREELNAPNGSWPRQDRPQPSPIATTGATNLDVRAAAHVLMRAGWLKSEEVAWRHAAAILLTGLTGDRYDIDEDHMTPEQHQNLTALTPVLPRDNTDGDPY